MNYLSPIRELNANEKSSNAGSRLGHQDLSNLKPRLKNFNSSQRTKQKNVEPKNQMRRLQS